MYEVQSRFEDSVLLGPRDPKLRCMRWVPREESGLEWYCTRHLGHSGDCALADSRIEY